MDKNESIENILKLIEGEKNNVSTELLEKLFGYVITKDEIFVLIT